MQRREEKDLELRKLLVPTPTNLTYKIKDGADNAKSLELKWDNSLPLLDYNYNAIECEIFSQKNV